jgi:hypothetical protein
MPKRKGQDQTEELESYLTDEFNLGIYGDLTDGDDVGLFEPAEFFKLFYAQYDFIKASKSKPLTVVKSLKKLNLSDRQKYFLFYFLSELIDKTNKGKGGDPQLDICRTLIRKEFDRLDHELYESPEEAEEEENKKRAAEKYDWAKVKQHLLTLPDTKARIKYLIEVKTEFQQFDQWNWDWHGFARKCELEIEKLERQLTLEAPESPVTSGGKSDKRSKGGTQYQNLLALYYLLSYLKAENNNTKRAKFASFLTGYSEERFRQQWSKIHRKKDEDGVAWERDMKIVRDLFKELGLIEIVNQIDNDLIF